MNDAVAVIDLEGRFVQVNEATARMSGYTKEELVGRNVLDSIIAKKDRDKIVLDMTQTLGEGDALGVRAYTLVTKDGREFDTEFSTAVLRDGSGNITNFVGVARDVTERKRAEEERERLLHELERSNAELQQFAHVASHDLQEPLRMVASYTQLLEKRYKGSLDADADDFIAYAVDGAKRMQNLIQGLLSYSRVGSRGKPFEPTECESVFEQALANLEVAIDESGAEVTHDPLPRVMADETQLIQLFQNLLANAIKFRNEKQPRIHISAKEDSQEFLFSVSDNGIGISPEYFERIFVIFQRLHGREEYPGTGIGLSVCKRIVERHGGRIWVESQPGEGSIFYFTIPRGGEEQ
jgi:PAS domain S-box-containing protein